MAARTCKIFVQYNTNKFEFELSKDEKIATILQTVCARAAAIGDPVYYSLISDSTKNSLEESELQREIPNGSLYVLKLKVDFACNHSNQQLRNCTSNSPLLKKVVFDLRNLLKDDEFAKEFAKTDGVDSVIKLALESTGNTLSYTLNCVQQLIAYLTANNIKDKPLINLSDPTTTPFVTKIASYIENTNLNVCKSALEILVSLSDRDHCNSLNLSSADVFNLLSTIFHQLATSTNKKPFASLVQLLGSTDVNVALNALSLINNLVDHSESVSLNAESADKTCFVFGNPFMKNLDSLGILSFLQKHVLSSDTVLRKQMQRYLNYRLRDYRNLKNMSYNKSDPSHEKLLERLWKATYPNVTLESRVSEQWKLLGFQGTDPSTDFRGMGMLGLVTVLYFAEHHTEEWKQIIDHQNERKDSRDYPVCTAGINVTGLLIDCFRINLPEPCNDDILFNALFDSTHALEEIYCITMKLLDTTWDEMNASYMQFPAVIAAVRKQISDVIESNPTSIDQFNRAATFGSRSSQIMSDGRSTEQGISDPPSIKKLKTQMRAEVTDLLRHQKMHYLHQGAFFKVYKPKPKQLPFFYCKISDNKEELLCAPAASNTDIPSDFSHVKMSEFCDVQKGAQCGLFNKMKKLTPQDEEIASTSFSLVFLKPTPTILSESQPVKTFDFICDSKETFVNWVDGFTLLVLNKIEVLCNETQEDFNSLISLQVSIKLLELKPIDIPQFVSPPPAPLVAFSESK